MFKTIINVLKTIFSNYLTLPRLKPGALRRFSRKTYRKNICIHGYIFSIEHKPDVIGCYNGNIANSDCCYEKQYLCEHYGTDSVVLVKRIAIYTLVMGIFAFALIRWLFL